MFIQSHKFDIDGDSSGEFFVMPKRFIIVLRSTFMIFLWIEAVEGFLNLSFLGFLKA